MLNVNDRLHGFIVREVREVKELKAVMVRMEYEKNGADLVWLDRKDENKTFAITLKTIPTDNTGVFHILEHSVLNGSEKYPVKEPFVELLKSSLQTFLNAMTFPDKTMYPVASRNDQDFLNLVDVYLDAVLHPLSIKDPHAFLQEGWHYELESLEDQPRFNGVVFNEMKGAYASADSVEEEKIKALLFPDICYGYDSGGNPEYIPDLTYEMYLENHARYYHPSNSRIFLDGAVDLEAVLSKIDSFLKDFDRIEINADIPYQAPVHPADQTVPYEISEEDDAENKVLLAEGFVYGTYKDHLKSLALSVIANTLTGSNEAPLKKAILDQNLAEDIAFRANDDGFQQPYITITVDNTSLEKKDQVFETIRSVLKEQADQGLDKKRVEAILNNLEFTLREKDYGRMPKGLIYGIGAMGSWLYGGDPIEALLYDELFATLREKVQEGYLEDLIRSAILENEHTARLIMVPSKTLGKEKQQQEEARLQERAKDWDAAKKQEIIETFQKLRERQNAPDTKEALDQVPVLSLSDIPEKVAELPEEVTETEGVKVLYHNQDTDGITYLDLFFSLSDQPQEALPEISLFSSLLTQLPTENFGVLELQTEIETNLGVFGSEAGAFAKKDEPLESQEFLAVRMSFLKDKKQEAVRILDEVVNRTQATDKNYIRNIIKQMKFGLEQAVIAGGNRFAIRQALSCFKMANAMQNAFSGLTFLRFLQKLDAEYEEKGDELLEKLMHCRNTLFAKDRLTLSLTGDYDEELIRDVIRVLPEGVMGEKADRSLAKKQSLGIVIPAEVGFAVKGGYAENASAACTGTAEVAAQLLSFGYLWNTIRVKGGAYGTGFSADNEGSVGIYSYRDPSAKESLNAFMDLGNQLRAFASSDETVDKYVISTISNTDPLLTPRTAGQSAATLYFRGITKEDREQEFREILHTDKEALLTYADELDKVLKDAVTVIIGGKDAVEGLKDQLDVIENLQQ